ncbi:MAG: hypothetical protein AAF937_02210 [Planctomycetota bacterium]
MLKSPIDRAGIAVALAVSAIGYFGGIKPVVAHQTQRLVMERGILVKEQSLDALRKQVASKESEIIRLEARVAEFRTTFQASPRINERIGELAELAEIVGVSVGSIRPGEAVLTESVWHQSISIGGVGAAGDIARFLSQLRLTFPDMGMVSFSFGGQSAESSSINAELVWFTGSADQNDRAEDGGE